MYFTFSRPVRNIWNNRLPRMIAFPRIIPTFWCQNRNNRPRLLFEEIRYFNLSVRILNLSLLLYTTQVFQELAKNMKYANHPNLVNWQAIVEPLETWKLRLEKICFAVERVTRKCAFSTHRHTTTHSHFCGHYFPTVPLTRTHFCDFLYRKWFIKLLQF